MLCLKNVSAGYGGKDIINNISLNIGENVSIIGPNGCGKTTLLKAIAGILPHKGDMSIGGKSFKQMKREDISKHVAMLSQQPSIYFAYSVFDTVMMGRYLHIRGRLSMNPTREDKDIVAQSLEAVHMLDYQHHDITKLSGGQLQRVFLARALAQEPHIILLDEPTNHLDLKCQIDIMAYLKKWALAGERTVIGVLHDVNLAMLLSENLVVMKDGEIKTTGNVKDIIASGLLNDIYDIDVTKHMRDIYTLWANNPAREF